MRFQIIAAIIRTDLTDRVVKAAKSAGATGATIIPARGTGMHEAKTFFGLTLDPPRDVILMLLAEEFVLPVREAINQAGELMQPGTGIVLTLEVSHVLGLESQLPKIQKEIQERLG